MSDVTIVGLKTCDACRAARRGLEAAGAAITLRDVRAAPPTRAELEVWHARFGDALVNRRSTTWRGLSAAEREAAPVDLLQAHPSLMKRPLMIRGDALALGWNDESRAALGL